MLKAFRFFYTFCIILPFIECTPSLDSEGAFLEWLNKPENGYVKKTHTNGFFLTLKYLPPEYLAYTESKSEDLNGNGNGVALLDEFKGARTFLLSIEHDIAGSDISNYGVRNLMEYKKRINELNFNIKDYIFMKNGDGTKHKPVLTTFENVYEIGGKKSFYLVFANRQKGKSVPEILDIVFQDPFFETGINHFVFKTQNIDNLPPLQFIN